MVCRARCDRAAPRNHALRLYAAKEDGVLTRAAPAEKTVPSLAGGLPFVGHAIEFRKNPVAFLQRGRSLYGDAFSFMLFGKRLHVLTGSAGNAAFFKAADDVLSAKEAYRW